ncbi:MAG: hypothetical protein HRU24_02830 [Gammaproteobacteria bacterium]|nr:hypothetical protein [Gammaproteobacteria bacterium]
MSTANSSIQGGHFVTDATKNSATLNLIDDEIAVYKIGAIEVKVGGGFVDENQSTTLMQQPLATLHMYH